MSPESLAAIAAVLEDALITHSPPSGSAGTAVFDRLSEIDPRFDWPARIEDPFLNGIANYLDDYVDALGERFDDVGGLTWEEAEALLRDIIAALREGNTAVDPRLITFQHLPRRRGR